MCASLPGLRCTNHAYKILKREEELLGQAISAYDKVKNGRNSAEKARLWDLVLQRQSNYASAERDFDSTVGGMKELTGRLKDESVTADERSHLESRLALARYNRETQMCASKIVRRAKKNSREAYLETRDALLTKERSLHRDAADALNRRLPEAHQLMAKAQRTTHARKRLDEHLRLQTAGFGDNDKPVRILAADLPPLPPTAEVFVPLQPGDFGRVAEYLPYGAYGRVTQRKVDAGNNHVVEVERSFWRTLGKSDVLIVKS